MAHKPFTFEDDMNKELLDKIEEISASRPGTLWYQPDGLRSGYWLRTTGPEAVEDCLVDIFSGKVLHASKVVTEAAHEVGWNEVMF